MTAKIVIDPGGDAQIGSRAFASTFSGHTFTLSNNDDTGVSGWRWSWLDTPDGSPTLDPPPADSFDQTLQVTPDVAGWSVLIQLVTYQDAARTIVDDVDVAVLGIRFPTPNDFLLPPAGETTQLDVRRGWKREVNRILAAAAGGGGGGGGARGTEWWNTSSADDGSRTGAGLVFSGTFNALLNRTNRWDGTVANNQGSLPELGPGDHNQICAFFESSGSSAQPLVVLAKGTNRISAGQLQNVISIAIRGAGSLVAFRYDENLDKWFCIAGGPSLDDEGTRSSAFRSNVEAVLSLVANTNDASATGLDEANIVFVQADAPFRQLTGISTANRAAPHFCPFKRLFNFSQNPIVLRLNEGSSTANQFTPTSPMTSLLLPPLGWVDIWLAPQYGSGWQLFAHSADVEVRRAVFTAAGDAADTDGEVLQVTAGSTVAPPAQAWSGQRWAVQLVEDGDVLIDPGGQIIENPLSGERGTSTFYLAGSGATFRWTCALGRGWIADYPTPPTIAVRNDSPEVPIPRAAAVSVVGGGNAVPRVQAAIANDPTAAAFIGCAANTIDANAFGAAQYARVARIPNSLQSGETWAATNDIYLSPTSAGAYTHTPPSTAGQYIVRIGRCFNTPAGGDAFVLIEKSPIIEVLA